MMDFISIGIGLLLIWLATKIISWISLRAGIVALAVAGIIFLKGMMGF